jgi:hypothetical protein
MSARKFKVGDVVADELSVIGTITGINEDDDYPYRISEVEGSGSARHMETVHWKLADEDKQGDPVNRPAHYTGHPSGIECIQITEHMGFNLGNALKYIWRCDLKHDAIEDLEKAKWYIEREIEKRSRA